MNRGLELGLYRGKNRWTVKEITGLGSGIGPANSGVPQSVTVFVQKFQIP